MRPKSNATGSASLGGPRDDGVRARDQDQLPIFPARPWAGAGGTGLPIIVRATGHSLRDDCIDISSDLPLEAGMVINLEAAIFVFGRASVHIEQSFQIHKEGSESLVHQDRTPIRP